MIRDDREPDAIEREVTADVTTLDLQLTRVDDELEFRLVGDDDDLFRERVSDADLQLAYIDE